MSGVYKTYAVRDRHTGALIVKGDINICADAVGMTPEKFRKIRALKSCPYTITAEFNPDEPDTSKCQKCVCYTIHDGVCNYFYYLGRRRQVSETGECLSYIGKRKDTKKRGEYLTAVKRYRKYTDTIIHTEGVITDEP